MKKQTATPQAAQPQPSNAEVLAVLARIERELRELRAIVINKGR